jgi:hypothetical protein
MNKEFLKMQKLAGIITESQYTQLIEDMSIIDRILDKISAQGIDSLTPEEKEYLDTNGESPEPKETIEEIPLSYEVKMWINKKILETRLASSEEKWDNLLNGEYWEQDFEDEILAKFGDEYPDAYSISQEVSDYIESKIYGPEYKMPLKLKFIAKDPKSFTDEDLNVKGNLNFQDSKLTSLPDNLTVEGDLILARTPITTLPKGLIVKKNLNLNFSNITYIPKDLTADTVSVMGNPFYRSILKKFGIYGEYADDKLPQVLQLLKTEYPGVKEWK